MGIVGSTLYYGTETSGAGFPYTFPFSFATPGESWAAEVARVGLKITDSLNARVRIAEATISNPVNSKESIYTPYRRIKIAEKTSGKTIFLGRVESSEPFWHNEYGQCLKVYIVDYSRELYERKADSCYTGVADPYITAVPCRRSDIVSQLVWDYTYPGAAAKATGGTQSVRLKNEDFMHDNFEWGIDGDRIDTAQGNIAWSQTSPTGTFCEIDTAQFYAGSRSARIYDSGGQAPLITADLTGESLKNEYEIIFRRESSARFVFYYGDGVWRVRFSCDYGGAMYYSGTGTSYIGATASPDTWYVLRFTNINFATHTYNISIDSGSAIPCVMQESTGTANRISLSCVASGAGTIWADDVKIPRLGIERSGSSTLISKDYTRYDKPIIQVIEELSNEDYWTDPTFATNFPSGAVWRWNGGAYEDNTAEADTPTGSFIWLFHTNNYQYIGLNNPFLGLDFISLAATGSYGTQHWEYWNGSGWANLTLTEQFNFTTTGGIVRWDLPNDWAATGFASGWPHAGYTPPDQLYRYWIRSYADSVSVTATCEQIEAIQGCGYDYYVDDDQVFNYFRRGCRPYGGGPNGLTLQLNAAEGESIRNMMHDYSFTEQPKELITRVVCRGIDASGVLSSHTAQNSDLENSIGIVKEKIDTTWGREMTTDQLNVYLQARAKALLQNYGGTSGSGNPIIRGATTVVRYPFYGTSKNLVRVGDLIRVKCPPKSIDEDFLVQEVKYEEPNGFAQLKLVSCVYGRGYNPFDITSVLQSLRLGSDVIISQAKITDLKVGTAEIISLTADKITAGTVKIWDNIIIATASGTSGIKIDASGVYGKDASGVTRFWLKPDGSGWFGASNKIFWNASGVLAVAGEVVASGIIADRITTGILNAGAVTIKTSLSGARIELKSTGLFGYDAYGSAQFWISSVDGRGYFAEGYAALDEWGLLLQQFPGSNAGPQIWFGTSGGAWPTTIYLDPSAKAAVWHCDATWNVFFDFPSVTGNVSPYTAAYGALGQENKRWRDVWTSYIHALNQTFNEGYSSNLTVTAATATWSVIDITSQCGSGISLVFISVSNAGGAGSYFAGVRKSGSSNNRYFSIASDSTFIMPVSVDPTATAPKVEVYRSNSNVTFKYLGALMLQN